jgi:hypothetical protein
MVNVGWALAAKFAAAKICTRGAEGKNGLSGAMIHLIRFNVDQLSGTDGFVRREQ